LVWLEWLNAYPETPMSTAPESWHSLKDIDRRAGTAKGAAFRAFRRHAEHWQEGRDFVVLDPGLDAARIAALKQQDRLYASSVKAILLSEACASTIVDALRSG